MDLELEREEHQMTDKQKEAIEEFEKLIKLRKNKAGEIKFDTCIVSTAQLEIVVNLIQTQQAEIEHQKEKRENQKKELSILNEKQKEFNKLRNTVNSYKGQFKRQQAEIEKKDRTIQQLKDENKTLNRQAQQYFETTIIQSQQYDKEITKKDKIIDEMANSFAEEGFYSEHCQTLIDNDICPDDCNKCVKQYFERKAKNE